jgi:hypothetical protein
MPAEVRQGLEREVEAELDAAFAHAEASDFPAAAELADHVFVER